MERKKESRNRNLSPEADSTSSSPALEAPSSAAPPWVELPGDVTGNILQRLDVEEILCSAETVCSSWWKVCHDPAMWRVICMRNPENTEYASMCRRAVDRSQGQLVDITMEYFGDDELIHYIAERSPYLKRLTLESCFDISGESLAQAVKILPHLVKLHLTIMDILAEDVEEIGFSCPKLESFSYNREGRKIGLYLRGPAEDDDDEDYDGYEHALAIGKSMPNLRHLQLFANKMDNEGLRAILEGCPHLESLDIRQCICLDLGGDLGKRCHEKIKDLKLPSDLISDIVWLAGEPTHWDHYDSSYESFGSDPVDYDYKYM